MGSEMTKGYGHTGILLFVSKTTISCISNMQHTTKTNIYDTESITGRILVEEVIVLRVAL
jgi:hypothetical protein